MRPQQRLPSGFRLHNTARKVALIPEFKMTLNGDSKGPGAQNTIQGVNLGQKLAKNWLGLMLQIESTLAPPSDVAFYSGVQGNPSGSVKMLFDRNRHV